MNIDIIKTKENILADNRQEAERNRRILREKKVFFINLMASPGAGKTSLLLRTIAELGSRLRIGVIEADVDCTTDAEAILDAGAAAVQVHTGGACHMTAEMTRCGLEHLDLDHLDLVFLENVGNLVCPAEFDVGADRKVMILSVPEGDDKPLKYPLMFRVSDCLLISKTDAAEAFDFSVEQCTRRARTLNPGLPVLPLSSVTGEGFPAWIRWLEEEMANEDH